MTRGVELTPTNVNVDLVVWFDCSISNKTRLCQLRYGSQYRCRNLEEKINIRRNIYTLNHKCNSFIAGISLKSWMKMLICLIFVLSLKEIISLFASFVYEDSKKLSSKLAVSRLKQ